MADIASRFRGDTTDCARTGRPDRQVTESLAIDSGAVDPGLLECGGSAGFKADPRAIAGIWLAIILAFSAAVWSRRWLADDGFINLRIVDNLMKGHGPVFNIGERVEAGTSQLWLALLALGQMAGGRWVEAEWIAVLVGMCCSIGVLLVCVYSQWRTYTRPVVPVAILAWVPLSSVWDFSSSGLETPLLWIWLAACFGALSVRARSAEQREHCKPLWLPMLIGLGPLIRPDATLYSLIFFVALVVISRCTPKALLSAVAVSLALPVAYEIFRAGFFGVLVPNTALVKAGDSRWSEGVRYLSDFLSVGWLLIPYAAMRFIVASLDRTNERDRRLVRLWSLTWLAALMHAVWVMSVGGDFMHARMLLADWLLVILPLAAMPIDLLKSRCRPAFALLVIWCVAVAGFVRPPAESTVSASVLDERGFYVERAGNSHPVTLEDHARNEWVQIGGLARRQSEHGADRLRINSFDGSARQMRSNGGTTVAHPNIGMLSYAAGERVHVVDPLGLADPIASRSETIPGRRIGHSKWLPDPWIEARFADPREFSSPDSVVAAQVLACPPIKGLLDSVSSPLTPRRILSNVVRSPSLTRLRIPNEPNVALERLC